MAGKRGILMLTVFIRSIVLVCIAVLCVRLMGKRQIGQLQPFEFVIALMIADLAATPIDSPDTPLWQGIVPMMATVVLHQLLTLLSLKSQRMRAFFSGKPTVVIRNGQIDYQALEKLCFNLNDLMEELRTGGIMAPCDVGAAIMETSGKLSVFPAAQKRPVTPSDLGIETEREGLVLTLILDGKTEKDNLRLCGRDEGWLMKQINSFGFPDKGQVLLSYLTADGRLIVHGYEGLSPVEGQVLAPKEVGWQ